MNNRTKAEAGRSPRATRQARALRFRVARPSRGRLLASMVLLAAVLVLLGVRAADHPNEAVSPVLNLSTGPATNIVAQLPVVARPQPARPEVGLPGDAHLDRTPPRQTKGLDLVKLGWSYNCMECHKMLPARWHYDRPMVEHEAIKLEHGNNRFCLNCHHATNRNAFADYDGSEIAEADVVRLCAKCHGTIYRDWQAGVHGRRNGFWDTAKGPQTRLRCIQCHDPHQPKFQSMKPLAPLTYPERAYGRIDPSPGADEKPAQHP